MPTTKQIDAAFEVAASECRWSINKIDLVRRMLTAAESVASGPRCQTCGEPLGNDCAGCQRRWES